MNYLVIPNGGKVGWKGELQWFTHLNLHYVIGWHKANVALHADHLPPVSLSGGCLI